jgi:hypothetical protein
MTFSQLTDQTFAKYIALWKGGDIPSYTLSALHADPEALALLHETSSTRYNDALDNSYSLARWQAERQQGARTDQLTTAS